LRDRQHSDRKSDHIRICLEQDVQGLAITTGLERVRLVHQALPEIALDDVDTSTTLAGRRLNAPLIISAMTGGAPEAVLINRNLAQAAQAMGLAMVLGSQRTALEDESLADTYRVRGVAPDVLLFANLGAVQLNRGFGLEQCRRALEMAEADGLALHLNPLQECLQPEGDRDFRGLVDKLAAIVANLGAPVLVKEVGWGISRQVAELLHAAGVRLVDVAGAGGTSWSQVEAWRAPGDSQRRVAAAFADWGIPTAQAILNVRRASTETAIVASGGIRSGVDVAKALALGATAAGVALPLLAPACQGPEAVVERLAEYEQQFRIAMFCTGCRTVADLPCALAADENGPVYPCG
jgi:isopentenyl-diphosphate delta-isomerase